MDNFQCFLTTEKFQTNYNIQIPDKQQENQNRTPLKGKAMYMSKLLYDWVPQQNISKIICYLYGTMEKQTFQHLSNSFVWKFLEKNIFAINTYLKKPK